MIINTELEYKGDLFPSQIISYKHEVDSIDFTTDNNVILRVTVLRDSMIRFRFLLRFQYKRSKRKEDLLVYRW